MNYEDPDGDSATSAQANQYRAAVTASASIWKITASHQAFYSSGQHGTQAYTLDPYGPSGTKGGLLDRSRAVRNSGRC